MTGFLQYGALATLLSGTAALAQNAPRGEGYYGHMWGDGHGMMGYGFFGAGMMVLFWIVIVVLAVLVARWLIERQGGGQAGGSAPAIEILKQRLARGEIDPEEYAARRKALED